MLKVIENLMSGDEKREWQMALGQKTVRGVLQMLEEYGSIGPENQDIHCLAIQIVYQVMLKAEEDLEDLQVYLLDKQLATQVIYDAYLYLRDNDQVIRRNEKQTSLENKRVQYIVNKIIEERGKRPASLFSRE